MKHFIHEKSCDSGTVANATSVGSTINEGTPQGTAFDQHVDQRECFDRTPNKNETPPPLRRWLTSLCPRGLNCIETVVWVWVWVVRGNVGSLAGGELAKDLDEFGERSGEAVECR